MGLTIYDLAAPHVTTLAKLAIGPATTERAYPTAADTFAAATRLIEFGDFSNGLTAVFADANRNRGAFDLRIERTRLTRLNIMPTLATVPTADEWLLFLPWILGLAGTGTTTKTYKLGNNVTAGTTNQLHEQNLQYNDGNGNTESFEACAVTEAVFSTAGNDNLLGLNLSMCGRGYYTNVNFPTLTNLDNATQTFVLPDANIGNGAGAGVILNSVQTLAQDVTVTLMNVISTDRTFNQLTQSRNIKTGRAVKVALTYPDGGFPAVYAGAEAGYTLTVGFINGSYEMYFDFLKVRFPRAPKRIVARGEVFHTIEGFAYGTGTLTQPLDDSFSVRLKAA